MNGTDLCGAYFEHLQAKHRRLNGALLTVRHQLAESWSNAELRGRTAECLEGLLNELKNHFAQEEAGGCLEEAAARCSSIGPEVKALWEEHPTLVGSISALIAGLNDPEVDELDWRQRFESLARNLQAHEYAENRLLQLAFGGDASDYDAQGDD